MNVPRLRIDKGRALLGAGFITMGTVMRYMAFGAAASTGLYCCDQAAQQEIGVIPWVYIACGLFWLATSIYRKALSKGLSCKPIQADP